MAKMYLLLLISLYACRSNNSEKITLNPSNSKLIKPKVDLGREYEDSSFVLFFEKFSNVVSSSNYQIFRQMSLDSLSYRHTYVAAPDFMKFYYEIVFDRELIDKISQKTDIEFLDGKVSRKYFSDFIIKEIKSENLKKDNQY